MTDNMMNHRAVLEKNADAYLQRDMISFAAERLMELEGGTLIAAAHDERRASRLTQCNGYRDRM